PHSEGVLSPETEIALSARAAFPPATSIAAAKKAVTLRKDVTVLFSMSSLVKKVGRAQEHSQTRIPRMKRHWGR
ncbi:MAG: hypothetical protein QOG23_5002, partial [Blastocatellia bacterium]|nr:hypothetical protein [Blastocatellia bacterium]